MNSHTAFLSNRYAFVKHEEIRNLPDLRGDTILAVKAPSGTTLTVPDPDEVIIID